MSNGEVLARVTARLAGAGLSTRPWLLPPDRAGRPRLAFGDADTQHQGGAWCWLAVEALIRAELSGLGLLAASSWTPQSAVVQIAYGGRPAS